MKLNSIRWRLPLTYAGLALLTALALGGVLLFVLRGYYVQQEREYLLGNALSLSNAVAPILQKDLSPDALRSQIDLFGLLSQVRVRLFDGNGKLLVETQKGSFDRPMVLSAVSAAGPDVLFQRQLIPLPDRPAEAPAAPAGPGSGEGGLNVFIPAAGTTSTARVTGSSSPGEALQLFYSESPDFKQGTLISVIPLAGTMYGFSLQGDLRVDGARSDQVVRQEIHYNGQVLGRIELSNGPAYGRNILEGVARGWLVASLAAVLLAAGVGWIISRRLSAPLLGLVEVTRQMSAGDLTLRAGKEQGLGNADEYGLLAKSFNEMAGQVEGTVQALRGFVSDAAHELNTPLTALRTNLELAAAERGPDLAIERAREQVERLQALTADLLDLSRIESSAPAAQPERVSLNELLQHVCEPFASRAEQSDIRFDLDLPEQDLDVMGQAGQLRRAVENLLDNALKFTPSGGLVRVDLTAGGGLARIGVQDSGIGVPAEDQALIFGRFHRGRNASGYPGSGLGLAIVRAILSRHAGEVQVTFLERGTRFELQLPLVEA